MALKTYQKQLDQMPKMGSLYPSVWLPLPTEVFNSKSIVLSLTAVFTF